MESRNKITKAGGELPIPPPPTLEQDTTLPHRELEGYRFHCRVFGEGHTESLIILHGGPGGDLHYLLPIRALAKRYRLIFYDQRGAGLSPRASATQLHLEQYLRDLKAFVDHFSKAGPLSLLGHSWGAHLALQYVAHYPAHIHKLLLAEPFIPYTSIKLRIALHNLRERGLQKLWKARKESRKLPHLSDAHARQDYFFAKLLKVINPGYNCSYLDTAPMLQRAGWQAFLHLSFSPRSKIAEVKTRKVRFPADRVLVLLGECNRLLGRSYQQTLSRDLQYPQTITIPKAGHYLFSDNPEDCFKEINRFLPTD